jgi:excisionase family DNA binding protein
LRKYLFDDKFPFRMPKRLFTTSEAAAQLGVTSARVRQMILKGELAAEKFGRDLMITNEAVAEAKKRKTTPGPSPVRQTARKASRLGKS